MAALLTDQRLFSGATSVNSVCEVLYAAAWVVGEFGEHLEEPLPVMEALLQPRVATLPPHIQVRPAIREAYAVVSIYLLTSCPSCCALG